MGQLLVPTPYTKKQVQILVKWFDGVEEMRSIPMQQAEMDALQLRRYTQDSTTTILRYVGRTDTGARRYAEDYTAREYLHGRTLPCQ